MITEASAVPSTSLRSTLATATSAAPGAATSTSNTASSTTAPGANAVLGETDFLTLLTTQLKNQDPLSPMDNTQSVSELAQFSALQATSTMSSDFTKFQSNFAVQQASGMLGKSVTVSSTDSTGASSALAGTVKAIQVVNGSPEFTMVDSSGKAITGTNGTPTEFTTSQILTIAQ
jgi:flagellar basal-body rod modification protein FlgD